MATTLSEVKDKNKSYWVNPAAVSCLSEDTECDGVGSLIHFIGSDWYVRLALSPYQIMDQLGFNSGG